MVGYVGVDLNDYLKKSSECMRKASLPLEEENNNDIERLPSEFSNGRMGLSQKLAQQKMSKNGENNFGNRNNNSRGGIHIISSEGQNNAKMAAKRNGSSRYRRYHEFFDPRSDRQSTEQLDLYLDKYEKDHGFEPVDMDLVGIEIMPKIAALEQLLSREKKCCLDDDAETIEEDLLEKIISNSPFSSLELSNRTAETVIGRDGGDNNGKVNSKSQPLTRIKDESKKIPQKPVILLARTPTDKTSLLSSSENDTSKVQTVHQNIDTQQKKRIQVDNTEVARNNKNNNSSCDKKTSENATASIVITSPQKRPPPQHIDNSLKRDATFTRENYGGAATTLATSTGNRSELRIYDENVKNTNPPGKFQNNQSHSQGKKITSASASQQRPPPGPEFAKDKKIDSQKQKVNKTTWPTSNANSINFEGKGRVDHAKSSKSKIPVLLPKTREKLAAPSCSKEGKTLAKQKDVTLLWKPPVQLPTIYEEDSSEKSASPRRHDNNANTLQQVRQQQPQAEVALNHQHRDQNGNNSIKMPPENSKFLFRISEAERSLPVPKKVVVPFKPATVSAPAHHLQNKPDEVSSCLDLIEGLSRHTTWVMKKVLEFPESNQDASERVKHVKECTQVGEFFGFPYIKNELLGQFYISRLKATATTSFNRFPRFS